MTDQNYESGGKPTTQTDSTVNKPTDSLSTTDKRQQATNLGPASSPELNPTGEDIVFGDKSIYLGRQTITVLGELGSLFQNPIAINELRQDVRSWFMAYIPNWESGSSQNDLDGSIHHYEILDHFFTALVDAGIKLKDKGNSRV